MTKTESATRWMENLANDNSHGYSQANRWGPDYDCSSAVIQAWEQAGVPVRSRGATYTGNMFPVFMACGFQDITKRMSAFGGNEPFKRGDVLLNVQSHTAMYLGNNQVVHARSSEGNSQIGDQSGNEIRIQSYWNFPWDYVLRYPEEPEEEKEETNEKVSLIDKIKEVFAGKPADPKSEPATPARMLTGFYPLLTIAYKGQQREDVRAFQVLHNLRFHSQIPEDGYYGEITMEACKFAQTAYGLEADGEAGPDTFFALINGGKR